MNETELKEENDKLKNKVASLEAENKYLRRLSVHLFKVYALYKIGIFSDLVNKSTGYLEKKFQRKFRHWKYIFNKAYMETCKFKSELKEKK